MNHKICSAWIQQRGKIFPTRRYQRFIIRSLSNNGRGGGNNTHLESNNDIPRPWDQELSIALQSLVWEFRRSGHVFAALDPLNFINHPDRVIQQETISPMLTTILRDEKKVDNLSSTSSSSVALDYLMANPDEKVFLGSVLPSSSSSSSSPWWSYHDVVDFCKQAWCGPISMEVSHLASQTQREWWISQVEQATMDARSMHHFMSHHHPLEVQDSQAQRLETLKLLIQTHEFETILQNKFPGAKRFGLEGAESLVPLLHSLLQHYNTGTHVELGMAHRGRLNLLCTILGKPVEQVLAEFQTREHSKHLDMGDVKYHLGTTSHQVYTNPITKIEKELILNLSANPSHLEAIDPVVMGRTRAHCDANNANDDDDDSSSPLGIVIHGDAAVSGQGVVSETLQLSELDSYRVGGRMHVVLNNQVGFTTSSRTARSSIHCTDVFKSASSIPIIHVNGDHPDLVRWAGSMAERYRSTFGQSVAIDLICYRRRGHNELDDPTQTHPLLYAAIQNHPPVKDIYASKLLDQGVLANVNELRQLEEEERQRLDEAADHALNHPIQALDWFSENWQSSILDATVHDDNDDATTHGADGKATTPTTTRVSQSELQAIGSTLFSLPTDVMVHPDVQKLYQNRQKQIEKGKKISWATAEALAFGSLVHRGIGLRLAGQDCQRGTFNQRHAVIIDQETAEPYTPLHALATTTTSTKDHTSQAPPLVTIANSNLSEEAALAFEYGYSLEAFKKMAQDGKPPLLVLWEAQFGDFVNGAQTILDTFIASGESKWKQKSALVLLLPHGLEGQGPDHSSARPERFLQLCGEDADFLPGDCPSHRQELEIAFDMVDKDDSGFLDREEMADILIDLGIIDDPLESNSLFDELDKDGNGTVERDEWISFMCQYLRQPRNAARMANLFICCPTTPSNYFHLLRRQALDPLKPLIVFTPKWLLHHGPCSSSIEDMVNDSGFQSLLLDEDFENNVSLASQSSLFGGDEFNRLASTGNRGPQTSVKRVMMCSGKIAYDLRKYRRSARMGQDVVIVRFEQLSPFPFESVAWMSRQYPNADFVWVQEEPKNFGFWSHVQPRIDLALRKVTELTGGDADDETDGLKSPRKISYVGRVASSAPASGSFHVHFKEQKEIVEHAFGGIGSN